jgi:hypothetical protein
MSERRLAAKALGVVIATIIAFCGAARAQTVSGWDIGLEGYHYRYDEPGRGFAPFNTLDEQYGYIPAISGGYTFLPQAPNLKDSYLRAEGDISFSFLNYFSPISEKGSWTANTTEEFRAILGHNFNIYDYDISTFGGLGYWLLFNGLDGGRLEQYVYIPVGVSVYIPIGDWKLIPTAEYDFLIHGWNDTFLSNIGYSNNLYFNQTNGFGVRGSILAQFRTQWGIISAGPFAKYWNVSTSDTQTATGPLCFGKPHCTGGTVGSIPFVEPNNNTLEMGYW